MAVEHDFLIFSKDKEKIQKIKTHLENDDFVDGTCIYGIKQVDAGDYSSLTGLLRHTDPDELFDEIERAHIILDEDDYIIIHLEQAEYASRWTSGEEFEVVVDADSTLVKLFGNLPKDLPDGIKERLLYILPFWCKGFAD